MILLIDNRDSYTFNLAQLIASVSGEWPLVVPADEVFTARIPARLAAGEFSQLVISPGPGTPGERADFSGSRAALEAATDVPALGVCLGHQGMGMLAGATVDRAPRARHGFVSRVTHSGEGIFRGIPQEFAAVRYHSLHLQDVEHADLRAHARSEDGVVMGLEVLDRPHWGVQFHPESILTEHGASLVSNFLALEPGARPTPRRADSMHSRRRLEVPNGRVVPRRVETVEDEIDCEATFLRLQAGASAAFWLDSASRVGRSGSHSVLGTNAGSRARTVRYRVGGRTEVRAGDRTEVLDLDILTYLDRQLAEEPSVDSDADQHTEPTIPYLGGFFGYLGYECKVLTVAGAAAAYRSTQPDAYWIEPQAHVVVDHERSRTHLVVQEGAEADALLEQLREALEFKQTGELVPQPEPGARRGHAARSSVTAGSWRLSDHDYAARITDIKSALLRGDSYEVCLTDTLEAETSVDGFELYRDIRRHTPAPYSAYFRFETFGDSLEILSASPERFLAVDRDRAIESKPIKGTARRSADPAEDAQLARDLQRDPKTRAENLIIVDLLRNDLGRVSEIGSVEIPALMQIETYPAVHQLVSTIRGTLRADRSLVDLLRATFPGGSMTGAPKARTLEIIDALEAGPRGIYSGTLGFLGHDGTAELSIVIRTIVKSGGRIEIGAGGAIILDSDARSEIAEKNLKAASLLAALRRAEGTRDGE